MKECMAGRFKAIWTEAESTLVAPDKTGKTAVAIRAWRGARRVSSLCLALLAAGIAPSALAAHASVPPARESHPLKANECLPAPKGKVVLTISGVVTCGNAGSETSPLARFDMPMLEALPSRVNATHTPWTQGVVRFSGPLLRELIQRVGQDVSTVSVKAINDFSADIPMSDITRYEVLLATRRDGEPMPVRDFGPLFILYPFDAHPELMTEEIRFRSVWQVNGLVLR